MKIYVIVEDGTSNIIAISEEESDIKSYFQTKKLDPETYSWHKVTGKTGDRLAMDFNDLYLEQDEHMDVPLTSIENKILRDIIMEEKDRIKTTIADLEHYIANYDYTKKEKSRLLKALAIVESSKKTKRLKKLIDLDFFLGFMHHSKNVVNVFREQVNKMANELYIFINMGDD